MWRQIDRALRMGFGVREIALTLRELGGRQSSVQSSGVGQVGDRNLKRVTRHQYTIIGKRANDEHRYYEHDQQRAAGERQYREDQPSAQSVEIQLENHEARRTKWFD